MPLVYEINTRCWLSSLSETAGRELTLAEVPEAQFEFWRDLGFTHIWLMGVWSTGPRGRAHSLQLPELRQGDSACVEDDIGGSPYAVAAYEVSPALGGNGALEHFRRRLNVFGLKLLLDFIPNHLGRDHSWVAQRPGLFVQSRIRQPDTFSRKTREGRLWLAYGKDPYMGAWVDTVQLDYRNPATRQAMTEQLQAVAGLCDGVRCDMAMLVLNDVFAKTWKEHPSAFPPPRSEFWSGAIQAVRARFPDFLFAAEVYWNMETRLLELGFNFSYDKRLYDYLVGKDAAAVQRHLAAASEQFIRGGVHFVENHDEPRVASLLTLAEHRAAALVILGLPGMCLLHEGQLTGARHRLSVHLRRRRLEPEQAEIAGFYSQALKVLRQTAIGQGNATILRPREAWPGNPTAQNFVVVQWQSRQDRFELVVVNLAPHPSQCYIDLDGTNIGEHDWQMKNLLGPELFVRNSGDLRESGLFLDVPANAAQLFQFTPVSGVHLQSS